MSDPRLLTDAELELMQVLWERGQGTVRQVLEGLEPGRAYTTVATILKIMHDKGFLEARREGRALVYLPALPREDYQARSVRHVVRDVFQGDRVGLVRSLVQAEQLDSDDLAALKALVAELEP